MRIEMRARRRELAPDAAMMKKTGSVLRRAAKTEAVPGFFSVTIGFTDDATIRRFNRRFRGIDRATDVLSFPMTAGRADCSALPAPLPGMERPSLGDILISTERCAAQAAEYGHGFEREICFLALHGFLHLLGYDHIEEADRLEMEDAADRCLTAMGVTR